MYKAAERAFSKMFASKPADEFGLAVAVCPQKPRVSFVRCFPFFISVPEKNFMTMRKLVSLIVLMLALSAFGFAQGAATGDLHVTVKDPKGSVVTDATVTVRDLAKGLERAGTGERPRRVRHPVAAAGNLPGDGRGGGVREGKGG